MAVHDWVVILVLIAAGLVGAFLISPGALEPDCKEIALMPVECLCSCDDGTATLEILEIDVSEDLDGQQRK